MDISINKWSKAYVHGYILYEFIHKEFPERNNLKRQRVELQFSSNSSKDRT